MASSELATMENSGQAVAKATRKTKFNITIYDVLIRLIGIIFARAMPFAGFAPFGVSFMAMERKFSLKSLITLTMVTLGYLSIGNIEVSLRYIIACAIYEVFLFVLDKKATPDLFIIIIASSVGLFISGLFALYVFDFNVSKGVLIICDALVMSMGIVVIDKSRNLVMEPSVSTRNLSFEEKISLCIMAGLVILSFKNFEIFSGFLIGNIIGGLILCILGTACGVSVSTIGGLLIGLMLGIDGDILSSMAVFGMCGLCAGAMSKFGKLGVVSGFAICGIGITLYLGTSTDAAFSILEVVISSVLLFVIPRSIFDISRNITDFGGKDTEATIKVQDYVKDRLLDVSDSFRTLAETFISISDRKNNMDMSDIGTMFDTAADRVCRNCRHANECWEKNFNSTYKTMFKFLEIMEQNGHLELSDVDPHFSEKCVKIRTLIEEINRLFEIYKINQVWKNKLAENRELIGEQFNGVADIIEGISNEVSTEITFNSTIAKTISDKLSAKGIDVENIDVLQNQNGIYIVDMSVCATDECRACSVIRPILKSVLGVCMISPHMTCVNNGEFCNVRFNQVEGYDVNVGFAQGQMESDCGDNHVFNYLGNGKYVITLSDGMGTGRRASRDSETIVELLGDFMNAGFDKTVAVKLVNSIMVMKSADEAFATVDMCVIDLFTGEVEFIKNGAEPSFIKKDDTAEVVRATSLPVGMVSTVDIETFTRCVTIGDMIVMATDGIQTKDGNNGWLKDTIETADTKMPAQELADRVLEKAIALKGGEPDDDMTVIVVKIQKAA